MAQYTFTIYAPGNFSDLPSEDGTQRSSLETGETITFLGGGEEGSITVDDPTDNVFSEVQTDQTLFDPILFDGVSYPAGQILTPSYIIEFSGSDGQTYTLVSVLFSANTSLEQPDAAFFTGATPPPGTVLTVVSEENPAYGTAPHYPPTCFGGDSYIATPDGAHRAKSLQIGDHVQTATGTSKPILWIARRQHSADELELNAKLCPVRIPANALADDVPNRDLLVSQNHRMLLHSEIVERMFGSKSVLAHARSLIGHKGIATVRPPGGICYVHFLLDRHEVVHANGAAAESLYLGNEARKMIGSAGRTIVFKLFPMLRDSLPQPARPFVRGPKLKSLLARSAKNNLPLVTYPQKEITRAT